MKDYKEVVNDRYEQQQLDDVRKNQYSIINKVGFRSYLAEYLLMRDFIRFLAKDLNKIPKDLRLLDVGCGCGAVVRMLAEICGNSSNIYGTDLCKNRIQYNERINSNINIKLSDITEEIPFNTFFDAIFSFTVFMHLKTEKEIMSALKNVYNKLDNKGYFYWFELNSSSHFSNSDSNSDGEGYSVDEMIMFANKAGFKHYKTQSCFKNFKIGNKEYSSYYLASKLPLIVLFLIDIFYPKLFCKAGYNIVILKKHND